MTNRDRALILIATLTFCFGSYAITKHNERNVDADHAARVQRLQECQTTCAEACYAEAERP